MLSKQNIFIRLFLLFQHFISKKRLQTANPSPKADFKRLKFLCRVEFWFRLRTGFMVLDRGPHEIAEKSSFFLIWDFCPEYGPSYRFAWKRWYNVPQTETEIIVHAIVKYLRQISLMSMLFNNLSCCYFARAPPCLRCTFDIFMGIVFVQKLFEKELSNKFQYISRIDVCFVSQRSACQWPEQTYSNQSATHIQNAIAVQWNVTTVIVINENGFGGIEHLFYSGWFFLHSFRSSVRSFVCCS